MDVHYRCIQIVLITWAALLLSKRRGELRLWLALGAGCLIAFVEWCSLNVLPVGLDNYRSSLLHMAAQDGGEYTWKTLASEVWRFAHFSGRWAGALDVSLWLVLIPVALRAPKPSRERPALAVMLQWLAILFVVLSLLERTTRERYILIYAPYLSVLCALGFRRLSELRPAWGIGLSAVILLVVSGEYGGILYKNRDLDTAAYNAKLRANIPTGSVVLGSVFYWQAFADQPYFCGQYYLGRLAELTDMLDPAEEYPSPSEAYAALLGILKKRNIEYVIGCEDFLPFLKRYTPDGTLPSRNFTLVATIKDPYHGKEKARKGSYSTRIYRLHTSEL